MPGCSVVKVQGKGMGWQIRGDERQLRAVGWEVGARGEQRFLLLALLCGTESIPCLPKIHQSPPGSSHPLLTLPLAFIPPAMILHGKLTGTAKF